MKFGEVWRRKEDDLIVMVISVVADAHLVTTDENNVANEGARIGFTLDRGDSVSSFWPLHGTNIFPNYPNDDSDWEQLT